MRLVRPHRSLPVIPANAGTQGGLDPSIPPLGPGYFACAKFRGDGWG